MEDNAKDIQAENPPNSEEEQLEVEEQTKIAGGRNGIQNIGNTCYMNTGLQVRNFFAFCDFISVYLIYQT